MDTIGSPNFFLIARCPYLWGLRYIFSMHIVGLFSTTWLHFQSIPFLYAGGEGEAEACTTSNSQCKVIKFSNDGGRLAEKSPSTYSILASLANLLFTMVEL